jgi:hypothetical protein
MRASYLHINTPDKAVDMSTHFAYCCPNHFSASTSHWGSRVKGAMTRVRPRSRWPG